MVGRDASVVPVGVFDSGVGGLSVLRDLLATLPDEHFNYLADTAFLPYGDKSQAAISRRVLQVGRWFKQTMACKALVVACNTATAAGVEPLRAEFPLWPIVGMEPAVKPASMLSKTGAIGILATVNTLASQRFQSLVQRFAPTAQVFAIPCPGLVELIEATPMDRAAIAQHIAPAMQAFRAHGVDVVALGCTHYPFVADLIQQAMGEGVAVMDSGMPVARQLCRRLDETGTQAPVGGSTAGAGMTDLQRVQFWTTGDPLLLAAQIEALLGSGWKGVTVSALQLPEAVSPPEGIVPG